MARVNLSVDRAKVLRDYLDEHIALIESGECTIKPNPMIALDVDIYNEGRFGPMRVAITNGVMGYEKAI